MDQLKIAGKLRSGLTIEETACPTCGQERNSDRKRRIYRTMVGQVIERARVESKEVISREEAIKRIEVYEPRIREYLAG
jgi:hypothetical protein